MSKLNTQTYTDLECEMSTFFQDSKLRAVWLDK